LLSLVGLGIGISVQAQQPDEVDITGIEGQAVSSAATHWSTHPVSSYVTIYATGTMTGPSSTLEFTATVPISPTVVVSGCGEITVTVTYTPSGSVPVTIEGATPNIALVELPVTKGRYSDWPIHGWKTIVYKVDREIKTSIRVTGTGPVTITGGGPIGGETGMLIEGDLGFCKLFLPNTARSNVVFYDDFSNPNSGWPSATYDICSYGYKDGRYQVKVYEYNERCIVPAFPVPPVSTGTYSVTVRRTTSTGRELMYGFFFGQVGADALKNHWALEVRPDPVWDDKPYLWLSATVDGERKYFEDKRTDKINTGEDEWNNLKVTRDGSRVKVYINGSEKEDGPDDYLHGPGYFDLEVISFYPDTSTDKPVIVQFDDFTVLSNVE